MTRRRLGATLVALVECVVLTGLLIPSTVRPASAATVCATPGKDGAGSITGVVNTYYSGPIGTLSAGSTSVTLGTLNASGAATAIAVGDLLLIVQMQDGTINSTNSSAYGNGSTGSGYTSLGQAGLYEYVTVTAVNGSVLTIAGGGSGGGLINSYVEAAATSTTGQSTYQIVRVPQYTTLKLNGNVTPAKWDGQSGGIVALDAADTFNFNNKTIDVTKAGFRGGGRAQFTGSASASTSDWAQLSTVTAHGSKGGGIAGQPNYLWDGTSVTHVASPEGLPNGSMARGAPANAGGGGTDGIPATNTGNSGGGGGANAGAGGVGGNAWNNAGTGAVLGGLGGTALVPSAARAFMGGGGGAGSSNGGTGGAGGSSGGPGAGMVFMRTGATQNTVTINANGNTPPNPATDGGGGGGAGGSVLVTSDNPQSGTVTVNVSGGNGASTNTGKSAPKDDYGPGGGGGGGYAAGTFGMINTVNVAGGNAGLTADGTSYGAADGTSGSSQLISYADIPGIRSGAECYNDPAPVWTIGPSGNPSATGSFDGVVPSTNNNDFTAVSVQPANTTVSTNSDGSGVSLSATVSAANAPCIPHTFKVLSGGGHTWVVTATAPPNWQVGIYSNATCTTLFSGATVGTTSTGTIGNVASPNTITVYAQYTTPSAVTVTPYQRLDGSLSAYISGQSGDSNLTHDELYFGYLSVVKSVAVQTSTCAGGTGMCPGSVVKFSLTYTNTINSASAATENALSPVPYPLAKSLTISDDGGTNGNWGTFSNGLNSAPTDTTSGTTFTYTKNGVPQGTAAGATQFVATIGGSGFSGLQPGASGSITFYVTVK